MGILHFRSRRATSTQILPSRPLQPSTHNVNGSPTSRLSNRQYGIQDCDISYREANYKSTSESSGDESCCEAESKQWIDSALLNNPGLHYARQHLLLAARAQFEQFCSEAIYTEPPHYEQIQQEPSNGSIWPLPTDPITDCTSDDSFVIIPTLARHFHYRCPFNAANPRRYQSCLIHHELHSIKSVIKHVKRHHAKPPYCPRCSKVFETVAKCDRHILERRCRTRPLIIPDGVNFYQKGRLSKKRDYQLSNRRHWERIYKRIFPEAESCPSPYLDTGVGLTVSMARDFWNMEGRNVVSEFLGAQNWLTSDLGEHVPVALVELVMCDLIGQLVEEG